MDWETRLRDSKAMPSGADGHFLNLSRTPEPAKSSQVKVK